MKCTAKSTITFLTLCMLIWPALCQGQEKKGLLVYDTIYGSTIEVAYWIRAIIGEDQHVEVKKLDQVVTAEPYDYVIIGSHTREEKPSEPVYEFVQRNLNVLAQKEVAYFLTCGDNDETMILKTPGGTPHLIAGRNYLIDVLEKFPSIKPVALGGFGGRQVNRTLNMKDSLFFIYGS